MDTTEDKSRECLQAAEILRDRLKEETDVGLLFMADRVEVDPDSLKQKFRIAAYVPVITDVWIDYSYFSENGLSLSEILSKTQLDEFILNGIKRILSTIKELADDSGRIFPPTAR